LGLIYVAAFARFFTAIVRAAPTVTFAAAFRTGEKVSEDEFHDELELKLLADSTLGGRISRRDPLEGGSDNLMHDGIVAELKVENATPRAIENCARYIGQPTQYGVGHGRGLIHPRCAPPQSEAGVDRRAGELHRLGRPRHAWLHRPPLPSLVAVVITNTRWILPSS